MVRVLSCILGVLALLASAPPTLAQPGGAYVDDPPQGPAGRRTRTSITVTPDQGPGRLLYRDCTAWLEKEFRPSGTVIVPRQRCWWVRR